MSSQPYTSGQVNFIYDSSNGYWYAHKETGIFVSPGGYFQYAHGKKYLDVFSKNPDYAGSSWIANSGSACCLPDEVGTGIKDLRAFSG
ncbi:hypothetical protein ColKHC_06612 [Colletotrichum higginsianum]|nr:hypothetical protein ColKHC_06612 [Colletotrichum higginsianum]